LVDWPTIAALAGLLMLTKAIETSCALDTLGHWLTRRLASERAAAFSLVLASALLAMLLTNDVALFVTVPLSLSLCRVGGMAPARLVVFEALAVNAGSALTPIGNPQNLFLWQRAQVPFVQFVVQMLPLVSFMLVALLLLTACAFRGRPLREHADEHGRPIDVRLLGLALLLYVPFLVAADLGHALLACAGVAVVFAFAQPQVLRRIDWSLLMVFVLMFIVLRSVAGLPLVHAWVATLGLDRPQRLFVAGIAVSQVVSNVPAAIALAGVSSDWRVLATSVNIGGFGLVVGSLANLIALRLAGDREAGGEFHRWSIPYLALVAVGTYAAMFWAR
jgi:Na+/H+ antiporter NhaD/arsenite permease-like protein